MDGFPVYFGTLITPAGAALEVWATSADSLPKFQRALSDYIDGTPGSPKALFFSPEFRLRPVGVDVTRGLSEQRKAEMRAQLERMEPSKAKEVEVTYKCACCKDTGMRVMHHTGNRVPCPQCGPML